MNTVFVLVTDERYLSKAKKTIIDLRAAGQWNGDIVLINVDIPNLNPNFLDFYRIAEKRFPEIKEKDELLDILLHSPFSDTIDGREIHKKNQWEKLHVMDPYFKKWDRVVFLDAGLRVLHNVHETVLQLDYKGKFLAPDDGGNFHPTSPNPHKLFGSQISFNSQELITNLEHDFPKINHFKETYFLNCIWLYDTSILDICTKAEMVAGILKYPVCRTNEMALMNLFLHYKYGLWEKFPNASNEKILFDWCETNNPNRNSNWRHYCFLKYPVSINFEDT
jgi:hypothetical protein